MKPYFFVTITSALVENDKKYFIQNNLHSYKYIFTTSPVVYECHSKKTILLLKQTSYRGIIINFHKNWSTVQQERVQVLRVDDNPTVRSLKNKPHE